MTDLPVFLPKLAATLLNVAYISVGLAAVWILGAGVYLAFLAASAAILG